MKIYEVGGAVRDYFLGKIPHDIDYVVVGATPEHLLKCGFIQVGKSFPVFLHPDTKAEYALARKEIKTGKKHTDFAFDFSANITLEEDLVRRDFTCNALAKNLETGLITDKFGGISDIKNKILRHINSEHFIEDPLRVLRMCRFSAQLEFEIAPETMTLAKNMVNSGMLKYLSAERIREELLKSFQSVGFMRAIHALKTCGAIDFLFSNLSKKLKNENILQKFYADLSACKSLEEKAKFAVFFCPLTDKQTILQDCRKIGLPKNYQEFILNFCSYKQYLITHNQADDKFLFDMLKHTGRLRDIFQTELIFQILHCLGHEQEYNRKRCRVIFDLCNNNPVNTMPNFTDLAKGEIISQKYKEYILQKLKNSK